MGKLDLRIHRCWANMKQRCGNPNNPAYHNYGGRGIVVCDEWQTFEGFQSWAEDNGYTDELLIDRIDVNGSYSPENCRWVDRKTQQRNTRSNVLVQHGDKIQPIAAWAEEYGLHPETLRKRLLQGWAVEEALTTAPDPRNGEQERVRDPITGRFAK